MVNDAAMPSLPESPGPVGRPLLSYQIVYLLPCEEIYECYLVMHKNVILRYR